MPARRKLTDAGLARIREVAQIRDDTPTDKELAREFKVSTHTVRHEMEDYRIRMREGLPVSQRRSRNLSMESLDAIIAEHRLDECQ